jgi:dimethylaniline monooxygenase (N-oxide forming)
VVVIGGSKSATDLCTSAAKHGAASVHWIYRRDVWRVPYHVAGINFKHLFFTRFQEAQYRDWAPQGVGALLMRGLWPASRLSFKAVETILRVQLGLDRRGMVPDHPLEPSVNCAAPIVTPGFFEAIDRGAIQPHRTEVREYLDDGVHLVLTDGTRIAADVVVQATGWHQGFPFLPDAVMRTLVNADGQYRLHRHAVHPDVPGLGFVGANSSFYTTLTSEMVAEWLVRYVDGQLAHQPTRSEMLAAIDRSIAWRRDVRPAAAQYGGLCVAPLHYRHFDELLADMGARKANTGWLRECFSWPRAERLRACIESTPDYSVV